MIRQRNPHPHRTPAVRQLGSNRVADPGCSIWRYNMTKLSRLSSYWALNLTGTDRATWDTAGFTSNGFESFLQQNLCGYQLSPGLTEPVLGQNFGDATDCSSWTFDPPIPLFNPLGHGPTKLTLTLVITGNDKFTLTDLTGSGDVTTRAESVTIYFTRPWKVTYNARMNPLLRCGKFLCSASGALSFYLDPSETNPAPLKTLFERVIGGAVTGQKVTYGWRFSARRLPVSYCGPLHTATATVL